MINREGLDKEQLREKLRDIPPMHTWSLLSKLGDHDHREKPGDNEEEVVLVIRGELLKRYPTAVIYAQKARWQLDTDGADRTAKEPREFETDGARRRTGCARRCTRPRPIPDITFLGFDLTAKEVQGRHGRAGQTTSPAGSSSSRSGRASRASAWISNATADARRSGTTSPGRMSPNEQRLPAHQAGGPTLTLTQPASPDRRRGRAARRRQELKWRPT